MKSTIVAALALAGLLVGTQAQALPMPAAPGLAATQSGVTLVRQGCGFGAHRGPYGGCRLNNGPRGMIRGALRGAPRRFCPPGTHRIPRSGVCRRNFR